MKRDRWEQDQISHMKVGESDEAVPLGAGPDLTHEGATWKPHMNKSRSLRL